MSISSAVPRPAISYPAPNALAPSSSKPAFKFKPSGGGLFGSLGSLPPKTATTATASSSVFRFKPPTLTAALAVKKEPTDSDDAVMFLSSSGSAGAPAVSSSVVKQQTSPVKKEMLQISPSPPPLPPPLPLTPVVVKTAQDITEQFAVETPKSAKKEAAPDTPVAYTPMSRIPRVSADQIVADLRKRLVVENALRNGMQAPKTSSAARALLADLFEGVSKFSPFYKCVSSGVAPTREEFADMMAKGPTADSKFLDVPCNTSDFDDHQLFEGGRPRISPRNPKLLITSPACIRGQKCRVITLGLEWGDDAHTGPDFEAPFPGMSMMSADDLAAHETSGAVPKVTGICLVCARIDHSEKILPIRQLHSAVPDCVFYQEFSNKRNEPGGYKSAFMLCPLAGPNSGIVAPVFGGRTDGYRRMYSDQFKCRYISQDIAKWVDPSRQADPLTKAERDPSAPLPVRNF